MEKCPECGWEADNLATDDIHNEEGFCESYASIPSQKDDIGCHAYRGLDDCVCNGSGCVSCDPSFFGLRGVRL